MSKEAGFERIREYSEIPLTNVSKQDTIVPIRNSQPTFQEYDDDHPAPLSMNPKDWIRDIKDEITGFNFDLTERKRIVIADSFYMIQS